MDLIGLIIAVVIISIAAVAFFRKKNTTIPAGGTITGQPNIYDGGSPSGVTLYEVFAPTGGVPGDVTFVNADGDKITIDIVPPSILIYAKDGEAIDGNYGIIRKVDA